MSIFQRRHYEWLADTLRDIRCNWNWMETEEFVNKFIEKLSKENSNFKENRFRKRMEAK